MELQSPSANKPARPAATVVMLRDAPQGMEVFLIKRHGLSDVLGGAYVFPGGKVDSADAEIDAATYLDQSPQDLRSALGEPALDETEAVALFVAAAREAFEECGVLFAQDRHGHALADTTQALALLREGHAFDEMLALLGLRLATKSLLPWSRWITPVISAVMNKRFDTRFFVATVPAEQVARHDDHEATESAWLPPRLALEHYRDGAIELAPPQIMSLSHLARAASVAEVLRAARERRPPVIQPQPIDVDQGRALCYPGDPLHPVRERALPGPTRLLHRNQRFVPVNGFEELLP